LRQETILKGHIITLNIISHAVAGC